MIDFFLVEVAAARNAGSREIVFFTGLLQFWIAALSSWMPLCILIQEVLIMANKSLILPAFWIIFLEV